MFGIPKGVKNANSIKIMIVNVDEPEAVEELSSYLSELKSSVSKGEQLQRNVQPPLTKFTYI